MAEKDLGSLAGGRKREGGRNFVRAGLNPQGFEVKMFVQEVFF